MSKLFDKSVTAVKQVETLALSNKLEDAKKLNLESEKIYNEIEKDRIAGEMKINMILENKDV